MGQAQYLVSGEAESPPNWQWVNRTGYLFPLSNMILWGMGVALGATAWLGLVWAAVGIVRGQAESFRNLLPVGWIVIYFAWIGNLWVMSMRYYLPLYPGLALLGAWALWRLVEIARTNNSPKHGVWKALAVALMAGVVGFTYLWGMMFTNIYRNQLTRVQASHWVWEQVPGDFSIRLGDAPPDTPLINIPLFNRVGDENEITAQASVLEPLIDYTNLFEAPADGTINRVNIPHLGAMSGALQEDATINISITTEDQSEILATGTLTGRFPRDRHLIGDSYIVELSNPVAVRAGEAYGLIARTDTTERLLISGAIVSHEGAWDDPIPTIVCTMPMGYTLASEPSPGAEQRPRLQCPQCL